MSVKEQNLAKEDPTLLLRVEHIKYRKAGPGKSPIGSLYVYEDRIEWTTQGGAASDQLLVPFSKIKGQRISPPNKPKVQLQLCMFNDDQATFVFMNPELETEGLLKERDLIKETLQQALVRHRQLVQKEASKAGKADRHHEAKTDILNKNPHLLDLYHHLVLNNLISPQDFWSLHYKPEEQKTVSDEHIGISGGFLTSMVKVDPLSGIRINLTPENIQFIFRTYPAVERKHLELVPHEMSENEYWSKFFQSHYFHRERNSIQPSTSAQANDPFSDCVKMDEKDMNELIAKTQRTLKRHLDLSNINEDLGIISEMRSSQISVKGSSEAKRLLVRRCNYYSERVLSTIELEDGQETQQDELKKNGGHLQNGISTAKKNGLQKSGDETAVAEAERQFDLELESHELAEMDRPSEEYCPLNAYNPPRIEPRVPPPELQEQAKQALLKAIESAGSILEEKNQIAFFDLITTNFIDDPDAQAQSKSEELDPILVAAARFEGLAKADVERIRMVHASLVELLRHFWYCFPPRTPELEQKIHRMDETLRKFEHGQLADCERRYGPLYVKHCKEMLEKAKQRYEAFVTATQPRNVPAKGRQK